jgi:hypothetical protein
LEGSDYGLIEISSWHLPHELRNPQNNLDVPAKIRTEHLPTPYNCKSLTLHLHRGSKYYNGETFNGENNIKLGLRELRYLSSIIGLFEPDYFPFEKLLDTQELRKIPIPFTRP